MLTHAALDLVACAGHLAVGNLVLLRPARSPLTMPLGLLALDLFTWNFADFAYTVSGRVEWHLLDLSLSPFSPALALHLAMTFVGGTRRYRSILVGFHAFFGVLAASAWLAFVLPWARAWIDSLTYSGTFLGGEIAAMAVSLALLVAHGRRTSDRVERIRTRMMSVAFLSGAIFATSDFWDDFGLPVASLTNVGTMVSSMLMAVAALRFGFLGQNVTRSLALFAILLSAAGLASYLAAFRWLRDNSSVLMVATGTLALTLVAAGRHFLRHHVARRERLEEMAILGRFSAQMAHDLKNPLAALKGAIQFLTGEVARGQSLATQGEFLGLIAQQVERLGRVIDDYQHIGQMEPHLTTVNLNDTVRVVLALGSFAVPGITVETALDEGLTPCLLDHDLMARAIENLVRNASEAMPHGGLVRVKTAAIGAPGRPRRVQLSVEDNGAGMDARQAERAFDDFFTTKAQGSGLGLSFVRRVVRAHNGEVKIASSIGRGTTVTLRLPVRSP